jgi:RNA polymerase sigma factor for flagellar operon FliA
MGGDEAVELSDLATELDSPEDEPPFFQSALAPARDEREVRALVEEGLPHIGAIARGVQLQVGITVDRDELVSAGQLALLDAARSFDPSRGSFAHFARRKIRWAMFNAVRKLGDNRAARRAHALRVAERVREAMANEPVDSAQPESTHASNLRRQLMAEAAAMALAFTAKPKGLEPAGSAIEGATDGCERWDGLATTPEEELAKAAFSRDAKLAVGLLPPRQRAIVERHYFGGERFDEIAESLGVSKSWASRLHAQAMATLAERLRNHR